tara:strand:- start:42 stop:464 length:423 start_codon:yes stop_codon:yes gene_type:complete
LEIASGTGQHGVFFHKIFPSITWQTRDPELVHRKIIISWINHFGLSTKMPKPLDIDVEKRPRPITNKFISSIKVIVCINMIHTSPRSSTNDLFEESKIYLAKNFFDALWTLFKKKYTYIESNMNFDKSLKLKNPLWVFAA